MARPRSASLMLAWAVALLSQATGGDIDEHCRSAGEGAYEACVFERLDSEVCPASRLCSALASCRRDHARSRKHSYMPPRNVVCACRTPSATLSGRRRSNIAWRPI